MLTFGLIVLYVKDVAASTAFYRDLLGAAPVESSANFAMFPMPPVMLGLWNRDEVKPTPSGSSGALEIDFRVADAQAVRDTHADWAKRDLKIAQPPVQMDFGYSFVALDPDGHRLRVMAPNRS
ncbi:VOC family protein [Undibacter mobilis]|uniref:Drug:proton antiporter n=1 Tax=Undibacter mobilis TaxID=2292256 RepID=A0A371B8L5_9BRAD|nr:VOC family protein [Undibacter mobilis]RDV03935.1 drug:proton antiporter [Undibacter mobilis]